MITLKSYQQMPYEIKVPSGGETSFDMITGLNMIGVETANDRD